MPRFIQSLMHCHDILAKLQIDTRTGCLYSLTFLAMAITCNAFYDIKGKVVF